MSGGSVADSTKRAADSPGDVTTVTPVGVTAEDVAAAYRQQYTELCRLARLLVDHGSRAEEIVQDCFARTYAARATLSDPGVLPAYVRRAVIRSCHSDLRRRRVERRNGIGVSATSLDGSGAELLMATGSSSDDVQNSIIVRRALASLPVRQREAVVLRYFADLDQEAVAAAMGCSLGTVKSQLSKARRHLATVLGDGDVHEGTRR